VEAAPVAHERLGVVQRRPGASQEPAGHIGHGSQIQVFLRPSGTLLISTPCASSPEVRPFPGRSSSISYPLSAPASSTQKRLLSACGPDLVGEALHQLTRR